MKKVVCLVGAALVALLILAPTALAQDKDFMMPEENAVVVDEDALQQIAGQPLPETGGPEIGTFVLLPAALLLASGVLSYAVIRRHK